MRLTRIIGIGAGLVVVAVAATTGVMAMEEEGTTTVTAYFDQATGVYAGSDLRILGVRVGTVESVEPRGKDVKVVLRVDKDVQVPKDVHAVVVAPSLVADRYVQLAPAYTGGAVLADGAELPAEKNATPVEVDQLYESITELSTALGPDGANAEGPSPGSWTPARRTSRATARTSATPSSSSARRRRLSTRAAGTSSTRCPTSRPSPPC